MTFEILEQAIAALKAVHAEAKQTNTNDAVQVGVLSTFILALEMLIQNNDGVEFLNEASLLVERIQNVFGIDIWIEDVLRRAERLQNQPEVLQQLSVPEAPKRLQNTEFYQTYFCKPMKQ